MAPLRPFTSKVNLGVKKKDDKPSEEFRNSHEGTKTQSIGRLNALCSLCYNTLIFPRNQNLCNPLIWANQ